MSLSFIRAVDAVANQLNKLLGTQVLISDAQNAVVTKYQLHPGLVMGDACSTSNQFLRFPICMHNQQGEVLIEQLVGSETISPRLAQALIDLVVSQVTHTHPSSYPSSYPFAANQQSLRDQVIQNLLQGESLLEGSNILKQAKQLGLDLRPPRAVILVDAKAFVVEPDCIGDRIVRSQHIIDSIVSFFQLPHNAICASVGGGEFVVLKASDSKNMEPWANPNALEAHFDDSFDDFSDSSVRSRQTTGWTNLDALKRASQGLLARLRSETRASISIGIGRYHPGLPGISRSYQDAQMALRLGRQFANEEQVHCLDQLGVAAFACVADERTKVDLAHHLLSPLDNEPDLLKTLGVFFDQDCALNNTAKTLIIHRNTLTYRLEKIASLTGLDPRCFDDAIQMRLALLLRSLKPHPSNFAS